MDWLRLAFGLIRDAVNTEEPAVRKESPPPPAQPSTDIQSILAEHKAHVDRNLEAVVHMLNTQNTRLVETNSIQRKWNLALAAGLGVTFLVAVMALIYAM